MKNTHSDKIINWGIIGLGNIANKFATDLLTVEGANLSAVASRNQDKANSFAAKYNADIAYDSYEKLVQDANIDAVYIATPHALHMQNTLLCLQRGIAVLCEKPFAMTTEEVTAMIKAAKAHKVLLMEALWTRFLPHYQYVLNFLAEKKFGEIVKLEADFGFHRKFDDSTRLFNKSLGGGSLLDIGIYPIFAALSSLGLPQKLHASATYFENGTDSSCDIAFEYPNNVSAALKSTLLANTPTEAIFHCERGIIKINGMFHMPTSVTLVPKNGDAESIDFGYSTIGYSYEIAHFNQLLRDGKTESDVMTFAFSQQLIQLLDQVRGVIGLVY